MEGYTRVKQIGRSFEEILTQQSAPKCPKSSLPIWGNEGDEGDEWKEGRGRRHQPIGIGTMEGHPEIFVKKNRNELAANSW
jgi:hypothetical protein